MGADLDERRYRARGEGWCSFAVVVGTCVLLFNWLMQWCLFASSCLPSTQSIVTFAVAAPLVLAAVVATLVLPNRRGARWSYIWHVPVALLAFAAVLLNVYALDIDRLAFRDPEPAPHVSYDPCYSGSGGCLGG